MNYGKIIYFDSANARGLSTVLFVSGCTNQCEGCHNKETWDFNYGQPFTEEVENKIIESLRNPHIKNFVIGGGDPLHPNNIKTVFNLCNRIRNEIGFDKKIIVYTGYLLEELWREELYQNLFQIVNYIIDGPFIQKLATQQLDYRGSINQKCWELYTDYNNRKKIDISKTYFKGDS